jgi:hypothetical protein
LTGSDKSGDEANRAMEGETVEGCQATRGGRGRGGQAQLNCHHLLEGACKGRRAWEGLRGFKEVQSWKHSILNLQLIRRSSQGHSICYGPIARHLE